MRPEEGIISSGPGIKMPVSYVGGGKLDRCPLQDQPVLLATESALQAPIPSSFSKLIMSGVCGSNGKRSGRVAQPDRASFPK